MHGCIGQCPEPRTAVKVQSWTLRRQSKSQWTQVGLTEHAGYKFECLGHFCTHTKSSVAKVLQKCFVLQTASYSI